MATDPGSRHRNRTFSSLGRRHSSVTAPVKARVCDRCSGKTTKKPTGSIPTPRPTRNAYDNSDYGAGAGRPTNLEDDDSESAEPQHLYGTFDIILD